MLYRYLRFYQFLLNNPKYAISENVNYNQAEAYYLKKEYKLAIQYCDEAVKIGYKYTSGFEAISGREVSF